MKSAQQHSHSLNRRQVLAFLAGFGITADALAQDAARVEPRSYRVVLENDRVRVLDYKSGPGMGVCGKGMHSHPDHVTVVMTGGKVKKTMPDAKAEFFNVPSGHVIWEEAETHAAESIGGSGTRMFIIEMKDKNWTPSTG